ncbi:MAG: DUF1566 domain-containing protein [Chitinophagaceae bacterium]
MKYFIPVTLLAILITAGSCSKDGSKNNPVTTAPTVTTNDVTAITQATATCGGNVTSEGSSAVTFRGVCWSTSPNPTIADSKSLSGTGTGSFTSAMTGLSDGSTYYVRAYATNSAGTGYGESKTFSAIVIGEPYQGGVLAYVFQPGDPGYVAGTLHGLVARPTDEWIGVWAFSYTTSGATGTALGTGNANTIAVSAALPNSAAKYCADLVGGGHDDWFMPSRDELNKLYINRALIGGFDMTTYYWASTEAGTTAWDQSFITGAMATYDKTGSFRVRAIRYF